MSGRDFYRRLPLRFCLAVLLSLVPVAVSAKTARFALVVGSNRGAAASRALRYAERDADRFAEVLVSLGGFEPSRVIIQKQPTVSELLSGIDAMNRRIRMDAESDGQKSLAVIYFSGHADGEHLELGVEKLPFTTLRSRLETIGADAKILFVDSCQSGNVTAYKGGRPGPAFDLAFNDAIDVNGTAILTSSAAGEKSQESGRLEGSFFTHFLLSGLQGTADFDQDQQVTLSEIYHYTYRKTVAETARTLGGIQHPTYDYQMTGRGKVVLTDLTRGEAQLQFGPEMSGTYLVLRQETEEVTAEVSKQGGVFRVLALPSDRYWVATRRGETIYSAEVTVPHGQRVRVKGSDLTPEPRLEKVLEKGAATRRGIGISASYGLLSGALKRYTALHQGVIALSVDVGPVTLFPKFSIGQTRIDETDFTYKLLLATGESGVAWRFEKPALNLYLGLDLGAGYGRQTLSDGVRHGSFFIYTLLGGLNVPFSEHFAVAVFWEGGSHVYRAEGKMTQSLLLRGTVGVGAQF